MTVLAFLRHGETSWTSEGRIQGKTDVPLSENGRTLLGRWTIPDECQAFRVMTSPLARCVQSAMALGIEEATPDARLVEMSWGDWEGRRLKDLRFELGEAMRQNEERGLDFNPPGGESPRAVLARVSGLLADVAASGRPTLAISHRGVIRAVFAAACGWDMRGRPPDKLDWNALHFFRLDDAGVPSLLNLNVPLATRPEFEVPR